MSQTRGRDGFTLVELMLALAFFSFILIFVLSGFLLITRNYNRGVTSNRIHQAGRNVMEEMVRELRQSSSAPSYYRFTSGGSGASQAFICYSNGTYRAFDQATNPANYGKLLKISDNLTAACDEQLVYTDSNNIRNQWDAASGEEAALNRDEIFVTNLELIPIGTSESLFKLKLSLATPNIVDGDDLSQADSDGDGLRECNASTSGNEYCDVVSLSTVFSTR